MYNYLVKYDLVKPSGSTEDKEVIIKNSQNKNDALKKFNIFFFKFYEGNTYNIKEISAQDKYHLIIKDFTIQSLSNPFVIKDYYVRSFEPYGLKRFKLKGDNYTLDKIKKVLNLKYIKVHDFYPINFKQKKLFFGAIKKGDDISYKCLGYYSNIFEIYRELGDKLVFILDEDEYRLTKNFVIADVKIGEEIKSIKRMIISNDKNRVRELFKKCLKRQYGKCQVKFNKIYSEYDLITEKVKYV